MQTLHVFSVGDQNSWHKCQPLSETSQSVAMEMGCLVCLQHLT